MRKIDFLRKKYPRFIYEKYYWKISEKDLKISFNFLIKSAEAFSEGGKIEPDIYFRPKIIIENVKKTQIVRVGEGTIDNLIFNLGLIELLSYWKATCSPEILIKAGPLNKKQIKWWKDLIINGMGQFFYENKIDFLKLNFLKIIAPNLTRNVLVNLNLNNQVLVPAGGGKDSVVTLELLKKAGKKIKCFSLNPTEAAKKIMKIAGCAKPIIVRREIDPKLLELNRKGFLNGHTPFSAYLAFLSTLLAAIFDLKFIALSNERSSIVGNLKYLGQMINHQYSKSFDFEKKFREYSQKYLTSSVNYFSFLRPLYEIQIAKLFSKYPKYFDVFLSCNEAYKTYSGKKLPIRKCCGRCPKCLFVFTALYPFIEESELLKIFRKNLFEDKKLLPLMLQLIGEKNFKPFECVGTKKESLIAFYLSWKKHREEKNQGPSRGLGGRRVGCSLLGYFKKNILPKYPHLEKESKKIINSWSNQHNLPKTFEKVLKIDFRLK